MNGVNQRWRIPPTTLTSFRLRERFESARNSKRNLEFRAIFPNKKKTLEFRVYDRITDHTYTVLLDKSGDCGHFCTCRDGARPFAIQGFLTSLCVHVILAIFLTGSDSAGILLPYIMEASHEPK